MDEVGRERIGGKMKFWEAMKCLEEGKKVRCKDWPDKKRYHISDANLLMVSSFSIFVDEVYKEWEIYEEPPMTHSFPLIIRLAREGKIKKFRRHSWDDEHYSYFWCDEWKTIRFHTSLCDSATFLLEDIEALDWIEVKE